MDFFPASHNPHMRQAHAFGASALKAGLTMVFVAGWLVSALMFKLSAQQRDVIAAGSNS